MDFQEFLATHQKLPVEEYNNRVPGNPLVSVLVVTYNHQAYIRDCLEGILMQKTEFPFEIVLGEDESDDDTRAICLSYAKKYPKRIRLFLHHRENLITYKGRPTGQFNGLYCCFKARGKYIAFCDGDDYWIDPLKLQKQVDFMEAHADCTLCFHKTKVTYEDDSKQDFIKEIQGVNTPTLYSLQDYIEGGGLSVWTVAMMLKRSILTNFPAQFREIPYGDLILKLICANSGRLGYLPEIMGVYRRATPGAWSEKHRELKWKIKSLYGRNAAYHLFDRYTDYQYHARIFKTNQRWTRDRLLEIQHNFGRAGQPYLLIKHFKYLANFHKATLLIWLNFILGPATVQQLRNRVKKT